MISLRLSYSFDPRRWSRRSRRNAQVSTRRIDGVDPDDCASVAFSWRSDIESVHERHLRFREDATNKTLADARNRIRNCIIPIWKNPWRSIRQNIWRTAMIAAEEGNGSITKRRISLIRIFQCQDFARWVALQRRAIMKWLRTQNISEVGFEVIERVRSLADRKLHRESESPRDRHGAAARKIF